MTSQHGVRAQQGQRSGELTIGGVPFTPEEDVGVYGRSVTFAPDSPMLPAPFR